MRFWFFRYLLILFAIGFIIFGGMMFIFVVIVLMNITREIDLGGPTYDTDYHTENKRSCLPDGKESIDKLCISAVQIGRITAAYGSWVLRAGFMFE